MCGGKYDFLAIPTSLGKCRHPPARLVSGSEKVRKKCALLAHKERNVIVKGLSAICCSVWLVCCTCALTYAESKEPLRVGAVFSLKGRSAAIGNANKNTVQLVERQVNQTGGINGYPLQIIMEDDQTLEGAAKTAVKKLIETDRVVAIVGPCTSGNSMAVKAMCEKAGVPMVSSAAAQAIVEPAEESRYIFKTPQRDSHAVQRILEQIKQMGITKIAVISEATAFGKQGRELLKELAPKFGIEIGADETFRPSATSMVTQLKKIQNSGVGAVINWSVLPTQTVIPKEMKKLGMNLPLFFSHGFGSPKNLELCGSACEGAMFPQGRLPVAELLPDDHFHKLVLVEYRQSYQRPFNEPANTFGAQAYDAIWLIVNAMKKQKITPSMEVSKARLLIRDGIEGTAGWVGTGGVFNMSQTDHVGLDKDRSLELLQVSGGRIVPLQSNK